MTGAADDLRADAAAVLCPRFPLALDGLDFGDRSPRVLPGGFCVFAAELPSALERFADAKRRAALPGRFPYLCSDLERGAGQQIPGLTRLPCALALGATNDPALATAAGDLTAREARAAGIAIVFAPVLDVADEPENPIVATRAFGADAAHVGRLASAFVRGVSRGGALATGKHFPGHGSTIADSHLVLPAIDADRARLDAVELAPFRAAIAAGVPAMMIGHLHVRAFDAEATPASLSPAVITRLLRDELRYSGLVVTDALDMGAIADGERPEEEPAVRAIAAGADVAVLPRDPHRAARAIVVAVERGALPRRRLADAASRVRAAIAPVDVATVPSTTPAPDGAPLATQIARRAIVATGPERRARRGTLALGVVDDGPKADVTGALLAHLTREGLSPRVVSAPAEDLVDVVVVLSEVRGFKGRVLLDAPRAARVREFLDRSPDATLLSIGCPQAAGAFASNRTTLYALDHDDASVAAAAAALAGTFVPSGRACWREPRAAGHKPPRPR